mmetsp:Transcript_47572/g.101082  ORF Transcript_47572/g.101082 Transcript_47572/m.101082 type:complete len:206 (-) Transcript_47572:8-625(-)
MRAPLRIDLVLFLPERFGSKVSREPQIFGGEGHHDRGGVLPLLREEFDPAAFRLAEDDHRIGRGQQLSRALLVHSGRVLRAHLVKRRDDRRRRPAASVGIIPGRAALAVVQLLLRQRVRFAEVLSQETVVDVAGTAPRGQSEHRRFGRRDALVYLPVPLGELRREVLRQERIPTQIRLDQLLVPPFHSSSDRIDGSVGTKIQRSD